jgi:hypothetical protein
MTCNDGITNLKTSNCELGSLLNLLYASNNPAKTFQSPFAYLASHENSTPKGFNYTTSETQN